MDKKITINKERCIRCGLCIQDCITGCLEFDEGCFPKYKNGGSNKCIACQHCMAICPKGALAFGSRNPDDSDKVIYGNSEELLGIIKSRRSTREYKSENIPKEKLEKIKRMLSYAPTGGNSNDLHFSIVETKDMMDEIRKLTYKKGAKMTDTPPILHIASEEYKSGKDTIYRGATAMVAVAIDKSRAFVGCETVDPIIALSYLELYAHSLGIGTLWCDFALMALEHVPEAYDLLKIPKEYTLSYVMLMGVPAIKYQRTTQPESFSIKSIR